MADVIAKLDVNSGQFDQKIKSAVEQMTKMEQEVRRTGATFAYADKAEMEFVKSLGSLESSSTSARTKLMEYTNAIASLTATYRAMTDEEKKSDFGKGLAASIDQIKIKAAELKDVMSDTNIELKAMASDTSTFDALSQGFTSIVSVVQVGMGAMQAFGVKNKEAMEAMARLQGVMAVTSGVIKIQNALQKQSAVMVGVATLQKKAAAAAEALDTSAKTGNTIATNAAIIAQKAFNAVAKANPYMLLATAIAAVTTAIVGFAMAAKDAEKASNGLSNAQKAQAQAQKEAQKSIAQVTGLYNRLKMEWQNLTNEQEKNSWIEKNKSSFESLGLSIRNVVDADRAFVTMSDQVVTALQSRAKANALQELYETKTREAVEASLKVAKIAQPAAKQAGDVIKGNVQDYMQRMGLSEGEGDVTSESSFQPGYGTYTEYKLTEQGAAKVNAYYAKKAEEDAAKISKQYIEEVDKIYGGMMVSALQEATVNESALGTLVSTPSTSSEQGNPETPKDLNPLQEAQRKITELSTEALTADDERKEVIRQEIEGLQAQIAEYKKIQDYVQGIKKDEEPQELNPTMAGPNMSAFEKLQQSIRIKLADQNFEVDQASLTNLMTVAIQNGITGMDGAFEGLQYQLAEGLNIPDEAWEELVTQINEQLKNLGLDPIKLDVKTGSIENAEKDMDKLKTNVEGAIGVFGQLGGAMEQLEDPGAKVAGIIMTAIAEVAGSFAKSLMGAVGPWDWIAAAIGGVSTMIATISSIKSVTKGYASGGMVEGTSYSGDNIVARLNAGEGVLTKTGVQNAAAMADGIAGPQRVVVEGRISGKDILLSANNTNRAAGGSRGYYTQVK